MRHSTHWYTVLHCGSYCVYGSPCYVATCINRLLVHSMSRVGIMLQLVVRRPAFCTKHVQGCVRGGSCLDCQMLVQSDWEPHRGRLVSNLKPHTENMLESNPLKSRLLVRELARPHMQTLTHIRPKLLIGTNLEIPGLDPHVLTV